MRRTFIQRKYGVRRAAMFWLALIVAGNLGLVPATADTSVRDGAGHDVVVSDTSRIVSIGGAVTEILYALGMEKNIVGIDSTSLYPARAAKEKKNVGYMRQLSAEGVLGLRPSLIVAIAGSGPKETISVLEAARIPLVVVPDSFSEAGIVEKISLIAKAVGAKARAQCLIDGVHSDLAALTKIKAGIVRKKRVIFVLSFVNGRAMAAGKDTAADGIIRLAGGINVVDEYEGYKPLGDEAVIAAKPDVILTMQRGGPGVLTEDAIFSHAAFSATPAAAKHAFISMEGLYLLGFGPRTARAGRDLALALYPELEAASLPSEKTSGPCQE